MIAVWAKTLPVIEEPVWKITFVLQRQMPSKWAPGPTVVVPAICQKTFFAKAPPVIINFVPPAIENVPEVWKIQTSLEVPLSVTSDDMVTPLVHL